MCTQHKDKRHANEEIRKMSQKLRVGILGATGMVGQRFISLLENHSLLLAYFHFAGLLCME